MTVCKSIKDFLDEYEVEYVTIVHSKAYTAPRIASSAHISGKELAKTVIVKIDGDFAMAVLPADEKVDFNRFAELVGADKVKLATEKEFKDLFSDCEVGAMPPFGNLYDLSTYISPHFANHRHITFNAGNHRELIRMRYRTYEELVKPKVMHIEV